MVGRTVCEHLVVLAGCAGGLELLKTGIVDPKIASLLGFALSLVSNEFSEFVSKLFNATTGNLRKLTIFPMQLLIAVAQLANNELVVQNGFFQ